MKNLIALLCMALSVAAIAATKTDDGGLLLTSEEVDQTIQYIREVQATAIVQQQRIIELESQITLLKQTKCL